MTSRTLWAALVGLVLHLSSSSAADPKPASPPDGFEFIDTSFENASPVHWDIGADGILHLSLLYDHQRSSTNRAAGHFHFQVQARPKTRLTIELHNLDNIWNGRPGSVAKELKAVVVSEDGRQWRSLATRTLPENRIQIDLEMAGPRLFVARLEPYRISDLERFLVEIKANPLVHIESIGRTVEGRPLEIVRVGGANAPYRAFIRARAHPWESAGNWVVQGLIRRLLKGDAAAKSCLDRYAFYTMPMANKDGVARGRTRFNMAGWDLNRAWDVPAPAEFAPENAVLERWLTEATARGQQPNLALDLHNDGWGRLHVSRPATPRLEEYLSGMRRFEALLREHTWFREGSTGATYRNPGTLGDGWLERFGIPAAVLEFNANSIAGKGGQMPLGADWEEFGAGLAIALREYFSPQ